MYASTLTLTDDFKKKSHKKMSTIRKGELMWKRLEQADKEGRLQLCQRRVQVGNAVGITDRKRAYAWVSNMVAKKAISETFRGFQDGKALYEYHLGTKPNYVQSGGRKKVEPEKKVESYHELKQRMEAPVEKPVEKPEVKVETQMNLTAPNDVTITIDKVTIKVTGADLEYIAKLVKKLCE